MSQRKNNPATDASDREIVLRRVFSAPRELVWQAWTDPRQLPHWWGPRGFTITTHAIDVRPGGVWRFVMHGPDGTDYDNQITYVEVAAPSRLVYQHAGGENDPGFTTTATFESDGDGRTKLTLRAVFKSKTDRDFVVKNFNAVEGGQQTLTRLGEHLESTAAPSDTAAREIVVSRIFRAPRELVWEAWTNPKHVVNWWGPRGFTTTIKQMDVRPGGVWEHVMHGPDGVNYPNKSVFKEVVKFERIVFAHGGGREGGPGASFVATWTFEALAPDQTRLTIRMVFPSAADRDFVVKEFGALEGAKQTLMRLSEHLAAQRTEPFIIAREFDAPRDLVWRAWTEREQLMRWFGPKGSTLPAAKMDFRPDGMFHFSLTGSDGTTMWGKFVYREIVPHQKLVWVHSFSDRAGGTAPSPFGGPWPLHLLTVVRFAEKAGKTTVTVSWLPLDATEEETKAFDRNRASMTQGWSGTMEQLTAYLAAEGQRA